MCHRRAVVVAIDSIVGLNEPFEWHCLTAMVVAHSVIGVVIVDLNSLGTIVVVAVVAVAVVVVVVVAVAVVVVVAVAVGAVAGAVVAVAAEFVAVEFLEQWLRHQ